MTTKRLFLQLKILRMNLRTDLTICPPDIRQMSLDAKALKFVSEFFEKEHPDRIRISELNKMKELNWVTGHNLA